MGSDPMMLSMSATWRYASVKSRRFVADARLDDTRACDRLACELHENGAGSFAVVVGRTRDREPGEIDVQDVVLANALWSGLRFLARHARDRAAAGGNASVRATISPAFPDSPLILTHGGNGHSEHLGRQQLITAPASTGVFDIDDLAEDGAPVLSATFELGSGLVQAFGQPEILQVNRTGALRVRYWIRWKSELEKWAAAAGVELSQELVD